MRVAFVVAAVVNLYLMLVAADFSSSVHLLIFLLHLFVLSVNSVKLPFFTLTIFPTPSLLIQGESAASFHNRFPEEWGALTFRALEEAGRRRQAKIEAEGGDLQSEGMCACGVL